MLRVARVVSAAMTRIAELVQRGGDLIVGGFVGEGDSLQRKEFNDDLFFHGFVDVGLRLVQQMNGQVWDDW